jgi:hypothetical protein
LKIQSSGEKRNTPQAGFAKRLSLWGIREKKNKGYVEETKNVD